MPATQPPFDELAPIGVSDRQLLYQIALNGGGGGGGGGSGTVTSVNVSGGTTGLTTSGGPVTGSGTITLAGTLDVDNGGTGQTSYTNGQLLIGNTTGNTLTKSTLTGTAGVTVTNGGGTITLNSNATFQVVFTALATDIATGVQGFTVHMPYAMTLTGIKASVIVAPTGANLIVNVLEAGVSILSTNITIEDGETSSLTAVTQPVISDSTLANDAIISINVTQIGASAAGQCLAITFIGTYA